MKNPFKPRIKYKLVMVNAETMERQDVATRHLLSKTEADTIIKSTRTQMFPWFYVKEPM